MKVLSNSKYIIRQIGIHRTQCFHRLPLRPFKPRNEIDGIQVNRKDLYPDASAVEAADIFDGNLPVTPGETGDEEPEEEMAGINHAYETPLFSDFYEPENVPRRTAIERDTL